MKSFVCAVLLIAVVAAEPPSYRQVKFRSAKEESQADKSDAGNAPYPASGFKPTKEFALPVRQELVPPAASYGTPEDSYGAPFNTFLAPQVEYGPPKAKAAERREGVKKEGDSESESVESHGISESGIPESESNGSESTERSENNQKGEKPENKEKTEKPEKKDDIKEKENPKDAPKNDEIITTRGAYFVLLPTSQLQRVQYSTENDITKMAYTASLQYMNENAPVYIYTPTPQYQPVQKPVVAAYSYTW